MKFKAFVLTTSLFLAACNSGSNHADAPTPVSGRVDNFKRMGKATKEIGDQLDTASPDIGKIGKRAQEINAIALEWSKTDWFPSGTGMDSGVKTKAKPNIWTQRAEFDQKRTAFVSESAKFVQTVEGKDIDAIRFQFLSMTGTCSSCHTDFRHK